MDFIPQPFDGGSNRILGILSGQGAVYFYDMEENIILSKIVAKQEICRFDTSGDGKYIACVLCTGENLVFDIASYVSCRKESVSLKSIGKRQATSICKIKEDGSKIREQVSMIVM